MAHINLLSIDGGGIRGLIPLHFLYVIENLTGKRIPDLFNLVGGTSTGAIVACGLSLKASNNGGNGPASNLYAYSASDIIEAYQAKAQTIFSGNGWSWFESRYSSAGIEATFQEWFGNGDLSACAVPLVIPTYDIHSFQPVFFKSRYFIDPQSTHHHLVKSLKIKDILRATTAAPTYFPAFEWQPREGRSLKLIDGGLFNNNPGISVLMEMLSFPEFYGIDLKRIDQVNVLSLGTGRSMEANQAPQKGGMWHYRQAALDIAMYGNTQASDYLLKELSTDAQSLLNVKINYLRMSPDIDVQKYSELDCTDPEAFRYFRKLVNKYLIGNTRFQEFVLKLIA